MEEKTNNGVEIRLTDLWLILKRCWILMLVTLVVVFAIVSIVLTQTHVDEYTSTATIWALGENAASGSSTSTSDVSIGTYLVNDYKQLIVDENILQTVIEKEGLSISVEKLKEMIEISHETNTRVLYVSVVAQSPTRAKQIADTLVEVFCERVNSKNEDGKTLVTVWGNGNLPATDKPSNPVSMLKIALIALVAAIAVYGVFFVLYLLDDKISTAEDVEKYLGVNMLGQIPNRDEAQRRKKKGYGGYYYGYGYGNAYTTGKSGASAQELKNGGNHANR